MNLQIIKLKKVKWRLKFNNNENSVNKLNCKDVNN